MPHFVDTNVVVYAYALTPKTERAAELLKGAHISVQVLNEFANVSLRKLGYLPAELEWRITSIRGQVSAISIIDEPTHDLARQINARYKFSFYDCVLVASALLAECDTLYSEDMQNGMVIEGCLTIRNPFV